MDFAGRRSETDPRRIDSTLRLSNQQPSGANRQDRGVLNDTARTVRRVHALSDGPSRYVKMA